MRKLLIIFTIAGSIGSNSSNGQSSCLAARRGMAPLMSRSAANASRSDTIDILHQRIELDLTQAANNNIMGHCMIRFTPKVNNVGQLPLDLLDLSVDSVSHSSGTLQFTQIGELLNIQLDQLYNTGDTVEIIVHYQGDPATDPSGFGGFYLTSGYLYNLGVAFDAQPHSYGRAWFPCFDNFVERNSFEFLVTTNGGKKAWCNGTLINETNLGGDTISRHWLQTQTIPSYLAALAASDYTVVNDTFPSVQGTDIPVTLIARQNDTTDMKNSFIHLHDSFDKFEQCFGPYRWDRVGYALTPNGAMEHPTLISYPNFIADGSLQYESTMAHELGHMWWGDLVTCDRAEEMWINEGFAEYLSFLMLEKVYGYGEYLNTVRDNHYNMVRRAHLVDGGQFLALANVPQDHTYGEHSYNKGADVIHTMRSYIGDSMFYAGLTDFLNNNEYKSVNSVMLRDHLTSFTGLDMTDFFNDWVLNPGWASFEVDSFAAFPVGGNFETTVYLEQKLRGAPTMFSHVPVTLTMIDVDGNTVDEVMTLDGQFPTVQVTSPTAPVHIWLNTDDRIGLAVTGVTDTITTTGTKIYNHANIRLDVQTIPDTAILRLEQYWTAADQEALDPWAFIVSPDRWWRISGSSSPGTEFGLQFFVDARPTLVGNLDPGLIHSVGSVNFHEDSLVVLHRADASQLWAPVSNINITTLGSNTDGYARITFADALLGDYCFGWRKSAVGLNGTNALDNSWTMLPNPAHDKLEISSTSRTSLSGQIILSDEIGRDLGQFPFNGNSITLDVSRLPRQPIIIRLQTSKGRSYHVGTALLN